MVSNRESLDRLALKERVSLTWKLALFSAYGMAFFGAIFLFYLRAETNEVFGTVLTHRTETSESDSYTYLIVRLKGGATVRARVHGNLDYRPGHSVVLAEVTTKFFGYKRYEFRKYVDNPDDEQRSLN